MNTQEQPSIQPEEKPWFYEKNGQRMGGISEEKIIELINSQSLSYGTAVWRQGFPEWMAIENTELRAHLEKVVPPPLTGDKVDSTVVWILAFAPILGLVLEYMVAFAMNSGNEYLAEYAMQNAEFWYITVILNIALSIWDESRLKKAGINTTAFRGWVWLVPVYLFQRAKMLKQNNAYFIVWIVCFILSLLSI